jgi:hypothetical protein
LKALLFISFFFTTTTYALEQLDCGEKRAVTIKGGKLVEETAENGETKIYREFYAMGPGYNMKASCKTVNLRLSSTVAKASYSCEEAKKENCPDDKYGCVPDKRAYLKELFEDRDNPLDSAPKGCKVVKIEIKEAADNDSLPTCEKTVRCELDAEFDAKCTECTGSDCDELSLDSETM